MLGCKSSDITISKNARRIVILCKKKAAEGARPLSEGARAFAEGARAFPEGARALSEGARALSEGARVLSEGARALSEGTRALTEGTRGLTEGTRARTEGARARTEGARGLSVEARALSIGPNARSVWTNIGGKSPYLLDIGVIEVERAEIFLKYNNVAGCVGAPTRTRVRLYLVTYTSMAWKEYKVGQVVCCEQCLVQTTIETARLYDGRPGLLLACGHLNAFCRPCDTIETNIGSTIGEVVLDCCVCNRPMGRSAIFNLPA